jgi:hypothetical protein
MKLTKIFVLVLLALGMTGSLAFAGGFTGQRTPLGILVTNWDCGPCAPANQALDTYMAGQGNDVALIRVHGWWPGSDDPMYNANVAQSTFLIENTPTGADFAPHLWVDNFVDAGSSAGPMAGFLDDRKRVAAPLEITIDYDSDNMQADVTVDVLDAMPAGDYRLFVAITEDNVFAAGTNGEPVHQQAFRWLFPDTTGTVVNNTIGIQNFTVDLTFDPGWIFDNLRQTVYVQEAGTGEVMNAATMFLSPTYTRLVTGPGPASDNPPTVRVYPPGNDAEFEYEFAAYGATGYGVNVATGNIGGEGVDDILTGAGPGAIYGPHVRGFSLDGTPNAGLNFLAYGTNKYGVNVAAGDLDNDGYDEIITGAGPGAVFGPHVRAWNYDGTAGVDPVPGVSYFAYGTPKWGVNVTAGDLDGDGYDEIVTGAGPGAVYGPHVRGWNVDGGTAAAMPGTSFLAYGTKKFGVNVSCGDVDGDGIAEIITGAGPGQVFGAHVRGFESDGSPLAGFSFFAWSPDATRYGATVAAGTDINGDGRDDLVVGHGPDPGVGTQVKIYTWDGSAVTEWLALPTFPGMTQGTKVAAGRFARD